MTKIAFLADAHVHNPGVLGGPMEHGLNERGRATIKALRDAVAFCEEEGVELLVSLGDLFHSVKPSPQLIAGVQDAIGSFPFVSLLGNHEMVSSGPGDHSLAPLDPVSNVIETPTVLTVDGGPELWLVPYRPGKASTWLPEDVALCAEGQAKYPDARILCLHLGISDQETPYHLDGCDDSVSVELLDELCSRFRISYVVAGNWHRRRIWFRQFSTLLQVGALCPTGFNNPGIKGYGTVAVFDGAGLDINELPGPRFVKVSSLEKAQMVMRNSIGMKLYMHATVVEDEYEEMVEKMHLWKANNSLADGKVDMVVDSVEAATEEAVAEVRAAAADEAVLIYIDALSMPAGVSHEEVKTRTKELLMP